MQTDKIQISNNIYCDAIFNDIQIQNLRLPNPYFDFPYLIINSFISAKLCKDIVDYSKAIDDIAKAKVKVNIVKGIVLPKVNEEFRKTNILKLPNTFVDIYHQQFLHFQSTIEEYFSAPHNL
ncbi:hypothetical protein N9W00_00585 [Arcobacteraceae bacterium]|nr:hypothetical protein [Arcobacteraceae bacterium]